MDRKVSFMRSLILSIYLILGLLLRFLTTNIYGILIVALFFYFFWINFFGVSPLKFSELISWFYELDPSYKTAAFSSVITILGFLIAFQAASVSLKRQMQAQARMEASKDINFTYARINELILFIKMFAEMNLGAVRKIKNGTPEKEILQDLTFIFSQVQEFYSKRNELSFLSSKIYDFYGRYSNALFAAITSLQWLEDINESIKKITEHMWIQTPLIDLNSINYKEHYLSSVDEAALNELVLQCEESHTFIAGATGVVKGYLEGPMSEFNIWSLINFFRHRRVIQEFRSVSKTVRKKIVSTDKE